MGSQTVTLHKDLLTVGREQVVTEQDLQIPLFVKLLRDRQDKVRRNVAVELLVFKHATRRCRTAIDSKDLLATVAIDVSTKTVHKVNARHQTPVELHVTIKAVHVVSEGVLVDRPERIVITNTGTIGTLCTGGR